MDIEQRHDNRYSTSNVGHIIYKGKTINITILDISQYGVSLELLKNEMIAPITEESVLLRVDAQAEEAEAVEMNAVVRWSRISEAGKLLLGLKFH